MLPRIGDGVQPVPELGVQVVEIAKRAGQEEVLADVPERPLDLALGLGAIRFACLRVEAVVACQVDECAIVDDTFPAVFIRS